MLKERDGEGTQTAAKGSQGRVNLYLLPMRPRSRSSLYAHETSHRKIQEETREWFPDSDSIPCRLTFVGSIYPGREVDELAHNSFFEKST